jgi:methyl-accepting chemotaxis protein/chorismate mutase
MPGMLFTLTGHDELSDVFDDIGDAARRMARRLHGASMDADRNVRRFTRETSDRMAAMRRDTDAGAKAVEELGKVTKMLWPAVIPAASSLAPLAAGAATVAVALGAMGAAIGPQVKALGDASEAQKAYEDAVAKSGARSQEAIAAQVEYQRVVAALPPATREAAAAVGILKDNYKAWSDSLAGDTMAPFTKGVAVLDALLPKTTGLVKAASTETDRFLTIVGGEMSSPGLDGLNSKFTTFAQKTLRSVNDELVHLLRTSSGSGAGGEFGNGFTEFMTWARAQGPTVASALKSVAEALVHVLKGASETGVGLLQLIEIAAHLVSAVPPEAIAMFLQLALALKVTKAAALGMAAGRTALAQFGAQLVAMRTAAAATPGTLAAARAAILALSRTAKLAIAGTGIGLLIIGLTELAQRGRSAPPDVDKLTSSLKELGSTGHVTGEASKAFGKDLGGLYDKVRSLTDPSTTDKVQQFLVGWTGWDSTPVKEAKEDLGAVDDALAGLVKSGQADLAAAALKHLTAEYANGGRDTSKFKSELKDYKSALADAKFEQQLAAESMGLFGSQAQQVQTKLAAQKQSADGLRQSIQALNDAQRAGIGGMIGFEASIDNAAKAAKENHGALSMVNGQLDLNSPKAQAAATALNDLAAKTDEAAAQARESSGSWEAANAVYARGRSKLMEYARAMGLNKTEAKALADQILRTPDKTARLKGNIEDLEGKVTAAKKRLNSVPASKKSSVKGDISNLLYEISRAQQRLRDIDGTTAVTYVVMQTRTSNAGTVFHEGGNYARGGQVRGYAAGGHLQAFPGGGYVQGPGTPTSDSIVAMFASGARARVSAKEYVVRAAAVARYGVRFLDALNAGRLDPRTVTAGLAGGGLTGVGGDAARGLAFGLTGSSGTVHAAARVMAGAVVTGIKTELQIASPSKKTKALAKDVGKGFIDGLTGSRDKIKSVSKDLATDVRTAFSGRKESGLLKMIDKQTKKLLDQAKKRDAIAAKIAEAKAFASDTTKNAREGAGLSNLGMDAAEVTAGGIKGGLAAKLAQIKQFSRYIGMLAKRGLAKGLLRQILNMGPEQGYAYASALAGADKATITSVNKTQAAIDKASSSLGRQGADLLYDSGKNAGRGFLKGLEGQQKDIETLMVSIAKSMQKAIKKALGIKSPSTVMAEVGRFSTKGLAHGLVDAVPHVDKALAVVAGRVAGTRPALGRPAVGGVGGSPIYNVNVVVEQAMDPVAVGRELQRVLLQLGRAQGATVRLSVGG